MPPKKAKASSPDDNLDDLFSGIGNESKAPKQPKPKPTSASKAIAGGGNDILADLESELAPQPPSSRPHTPRLKEATAATRRSTATPPVGDERAAAARKSTDSSRSHKISFTPGDPSPEPHERVPVEHKTQQAAAASGRGAGGGWWGGILSTASAAMKQAEAAYNQIQQNEEAKKWTEQVKGLGNIDVGVLKTYSDELRSRALPTFTNILHTLAPPISSHERLLIHISHDLVGYPSFDPLVHGVFSRVMSQVEGGDLLVAQRGHESGSRGASDSSAGWRDGPWWRQVNLPRELNLVKGKIEGTKLCRANAEAHASEYFATTGGLGAARTRAGENMSESNPVRTSDLFLSVQAIATDQDSALFVRSSTSDNPKGKSVEGKEEEEKGDEDDDEDELICFAVFILDPVHEIEFSTISQSMPARWAHWLDAPTLLTPQSADEAQDVTANFVPEDIRDIVEGGGVDPREWVAEWIEEALSLAVGVVAQRYVAKRMGVGERMTGRGGRSSASGPAVRLRQDVLVGENAGEAARAGL